MATDGLTVTAELKKFFFDRALIKHAVSRTKYDVLYAAGRNTRQYVRMNVLRRRKRTSRPGEAPSVHSRDRFANLRNVLYGVSKDYNSVVIGPRRLNQVQYSWINAGSLTVPQIMEFGAVVTLYEESYDGKRWFRRDHRRNAKKEKLYRKRRAVYKARPFMSKALEHMAPKFPSLFSGRLRRAA